MTSLYCRIDAEQRSSYQKAISAAASLSRLFSDNLYLNSKLMERAYCKYLPADNVALDDVPIDAKLHLDDGDYGIGLKTFGLLKNTKFKTEKVAEFDKLKRLYTHDANEDAQLVISAWNDRLEETTAVYGIDNFTYHCLTRRDNKISIVECGFFNIDSEGVNATPSVGGFSFEAGGVKYRYNYGKSVLMRAFDVINPIAEFEVKVIEDPFELLNRIYEEARESKESKPQLVLPLFSYQGKVPTVFPRSGLNQWNAEGRPRSLKEVYIPYNVREQEAIPGFFPDYIPGHRGVKKHFTVHLPNGKSFNASRCQSGGKGIMSQDNSDFGEWLLQDVLKIDPGKVVTLDMLEERGINAVVFTKNSEDDYSLDFTYVDTGADGFN